MSTIDSRTLHRRMTLEKYKALPEGPPKFEFENGELIPKTQPTPEHQDVLVEICHVLRRHVRRGKLGRVFMEPDVYLPDGRGYIPDVVFLSNERLGLYDERSKSIHGAPDLCVEVLSTRPSRDLVDKFRVYAQNKVLWYWVVDPIELTVEEYQLKDGTYDRTTSVAAGEKFAPALFVGLTINLKTLLEETDGGTA